MSDEVLVPLIEQTQRQARQKEQAESQDCKQSKEASPPTDVARLLDGLDFWHDQDGDAMVSIPVEDHVEHMKIEGNKFPQYLGRRIWTQTKKPATSESLKQIVNLCVAQARYDGSSIPCYTRIAGHEGRIYIDMGDPQWRVIEVTGGGWRIIPNTEAPIRFRRSSAARALPEPTSGGDIGKLRDVVNLQDNDAYRLLVGYILGALDPDGPYSTLVFLGEHGSGVDLTTSPPTLDEPMLLSGTPTGLEVTPDGSFLLVALSSRRSFLFFRLVLVDGDNDGIDDALDNCPQTFNDDQTDTDANGIGDACNEGEDLDGDEWSDSLDNCPTTANSDQGDADLDLFGDVCDLCPDFPSTNDDFDGNGIGDECECGDQTQDGTVSILDILAINAVIFGQALESPLCDTNQDQVCNVEDILGANAKIFGEEAFCSRYPAPSAP
jgi:hypothetical protein